jgi:GntR family transcriptional repressor for pyruvate dehydrogenase complex
MAFRPIRNDRLSDKIVLDITRQIEQGELGPGERLPPEPQLADLYGVSRGILREALTVLRSCGYIRRKPKDGTYVNDTLPGEGLNASLGALVKKAGYADLIETRECLELKAAEKVIRTAGDEDIAELTEQLALGCGDGARLNIDHYFHFRLAELSGNHLFMDFINLYYDLIAEIALYSRQNISRRDEIKAEHLAIAYALRERNLEKAQAAVTNHLRNIAKAVEAIEVL